MRIATVLALTLATHASALGLCGVASTYKVPLNASCAALGPRGVLTSVVEGMRGETEPVQVLLDNTNGAEDVVITIDVDAPASLSVTARRVGYVYCEAGTRYEGGGGGWIADPLLDLPPTGEVRVRRGSIQTLWLSFTIARDAPVGRSAVLVQAREADRSQPSGTLASTMLNVTVWPITVPLFSEPRAFNTSYQFAYARRSSTDLGSFYGGNLTQTMKWRYFDALYALRFPADMIYLYSPRPLEDYQYLATQGAKWFALLDVSDLPFNGTVGATASPDSRVRAHRGSTGATLTSRRTVTENDPCPRSYSDAYVAHMLSLIEPAASALDRLGLLDRAFVYGFDEYPASCEAQVRQLFGAVKSKWPNLRTMAVLNWDDMPTDMPVDVWVLQYQYASPERAAPWVAAGRQFWLYHCILPADIQYLNTFVERPALQARQLFWLAAQLPVSGWLYYAVDLWESFKPVVPFWTHYRTTANVTFPVKRQVLRPITDPASPAFVPGQDADDRLTDFDVSTWLWQPRTDIFANGDGSFMYPGPDGPIISLRFELQRDGIEDLELLRMAPQSAVTHLAPHVVANATTWTSSTLQLFETRRDIAAALVAARATQEPPLAC